MTEGISRLALERRKHRWSQSELGRQSGVNQSTISAIENGRLRPYRSQLEKIASALGWPIEQAEQLAEVKELGANLEGLR